MPDNKYLDAFATLDASLLSYVQDSSLPEPSNNFGFPQPGEQSPSPAMHTHKYYFADDTKWKAILEYGDFDDIVIGTGFCGLAYIDKALKLNPKRRILVLERGELWLMTHFQNLDLPFNLLLSNASETYPWALTSKTYHNDIRFVHGSFPFFGGRSPFWSAFSPKPRENLFRDFPPSMIETAKKEEFWKECRALLQVVEPSQLFDGEYQALQEYIEDQFAKALTPNPKEIKTATYGEPADLAVGKSTGISKVVFEKFSTPGPLLKIFEHQRQLAKEGKGAPLTIATNVVVESFDVDPLDHGKRADVLRTSRGALSFPRAKKPNIILATGAMPACTIVLNSIKKQRRRAGSRLSGHFLTHINARFTVPPGLKEEFEKEKAHRAKETKERAERRKARPPQSRTDGPAVLADEDIQEPNDPLKIAAYYLAGEAPGTVTPESKTQLQYHADITVIHSPHPKEQRQDAARLCPDFFSTPTDAQLKDSQNYIIIACVMLGEIEEQGKECNGVHVHEETENNANEEDTRTRVILDKGNPDKTTNIRLMLTMSKNDKILRGAMYQATLDCIAAMAGDEKASIEYWHDDGHGSGEWRKSQPPVKNFHMPGIVHEASTLYMDDKLATHPALEEVNPKIDRHMAYPSVDSNYRVYGCGNVYATGSALFPTSGSWNPTLTMCGYAQDLATKLHNNDIFRQTFSMSIASSAVNHLKGTTEHLAGILSTGVTTRLPKVPTTTGKLRSTNPIREDWEVVWGPAVWKQDAVSATTGSDVAWYMAYHPSVRFEDGTLHPTYVISVSCARRDTTDPVANFDQWVRGGLTNKPNPERQAPSSPTPDRWVSFVTVDSAYQVLNNPAPELDGVEQAGMKLLTYLRSSNVDKSVPADKAEPGIRFIFTGHGIGGGVAVALALALVGNETNKGILFNNVDDVFTYPSGVPSPGDAAFVDSFVATFPARRLDREHSYKGWNLNLVNYHDAVPQAWSVDKVRSPKQNLYNLSNLAVSPLGQKNVSKAIERMCGETVQSKLEYKSLPGQYFTGISDIDKEATRAGNPKETIGHLVFQHLNAYTKEVGINIQPQPAEIIPSLFPVIHDLNEAMKEDLGTEEAGGGTQTQLGKIQTGPSDDLETEDDIEVNDDLNEAEK